MGNSITDEIGTTIGCLRISKKSFPNLERFSQQKNNAGFPPLTDWELFGKKLGLY